MQNKTLSFMVFSLQEAFITLVPYLFLRAGCTLLQIFNHQWEIIHPNLLNSGISIVYNIFPLLLTISIAASISKNFHFKKYSFIIPTLVFFLPVSGYLQFSNSHLMIHPENTIIAAILSPLIICLIINACAKLRMPLMQAAVNRNDLSAISVSALLSYYVIFLLAMIIGDIRTSVDINLLQDLLVTLSLESQAAFHLITSHILWMLGIHGTTTYQYSFDMTFYQQDIFPGLPYGQFFSTFIIFGGAGSTLSLIIAIFMVSRQKHSKVIARYALPFSLLNINEPIIYGLPIIFNKYYLLPFITVPVINFALSYSVLSFGLFSIINTDITWTTPPLISGYILTGSYLAVAWQLFLIVLGVFIYMPFIRRSDRARACAENLAEYLNISEKLDDINTEYESYKRHEKISEEEVILNRAINDITAGHLTLYYQPIINLKDNSIYGYEALLRLVKENEVYPPIFLPAIENARLEAVIDLWVVNKVTADLEKWHTIHPAPPVSINIYPRTLECGNNIDLIISKLSGQNCRIEILEKHCSKRSEIILNALSRMQAASIPIAIDDFGTGYSNLSMLGQISPDIVKIDKSILDSSNTDNGLILLKSICSTCKEMRLTTVIEGVETNQQLRQVSALGADAVQGWVFSKPLALNKAIQYQIQHEQNAR